MGKQKDKWSETRKAKLDELFSGKSYVIEKEETLDTAKATPLGYKTKHGYWLRSGDERIWVGKALLKTLAEDYQAVELPEPKRRGRPKKDPVEQAEVWVGRDIPSDAYPITQPGQPLTNPNAEQEFKG